MEEAVTQNVEYPGNHSDNTSSGRGSTLNKRLQLDVLGTQREMLEVEPGMLHDFPRAPRRSEGPGFTLQRYGPGPAPLL